MAISFDALRAAVEPPDAIGAFTLDPQGNGWHSVSRLFRWHLPSGVLAISGATLREASDGGDQRLIIEGRLVGALLGFDGLSTRAELWVEEGEIAAFLTMTGVPAAWRPSDTFRFLGGTSLDRFSASNVAFTLDSRERSFLPNDFQSRLGRVELTAAERAILRRGLGVRMKLRLLPTAGSVTSWLLAGQEVCVEGPVELAEDGEARMWLRSQAEEEAASVWCFGISAGLEVISTLVPIDAENGGRSLHAAPLLRLAGNVSWESGGRTISLPARAELHGSEPSTITLVAEPDEAFAFALEELTALLPEGPGPLPPGFPGLDALTLDRLVLGLGADGRLLDVSLRVGLADDWNIVPGAITMRSLGVQSTALAPLSTHRSVSVGVYGAMEIEPARATLLGEAEFPEGSFSCRMEPGDGVDLSALLAAFLPESAAIPVFECDDFRLSGSVSDGRWDVIAGFRTSPFRIGAATVEVEGTNLGLTRLPGPPASTRALMSFALRFGSNDTLVAQWQLPGELRLDGYFDEVRLEDLARRLCGGWLELPGGFPDLRLEQLAFSITAPVGGDGAYGFDADARVALGTSGLVDVLFEIRKETRSGSGSGWGYVVGFAIPKTWSPADLWSELEPAMGWFELEDPGLILASMPVTVPTANLASMASLPPSLPAGLTLFAGISLSGPLEPVSRLFGSAPTLNLAATFARDVKQTAFIATASAPGRKSAVGFEGFSLIVRPNVANVELRSGANLEAGKDVLVFSLSGVLEPSGSLTAALALSAVRRGEGKETGADDGWVDPFGIPGLTIYRLGGALSVAAEGFSIAFEGELSAGAGREEDRLLFQVAFQVTNGALPSAAVAQLRSADTEGITLRRLVRGFTSFDAQILSMLDPVVLRELMVYLVLDPTGFPSPVDPGFVYRGLGAHADVSLYGLEARADFDFDWASGVFAHGALSKPVEVPGIVRFSSADGSTGPSLTIDTRQVALGGDLLLLDGQLQLFEASKVSVLAKVSRSHFELQADARGIAGLRTCTFDVTVRAMHSIRARADAEVELRGRVKLKSNGVAIGSLRLDGLAASALFDLDADLLGFGFVVEARLRLLKGLPEVTYGYRIEQRFTELALVVARSSEELAKRGWSTFKDALSDAASLWALAEAGLFEFASDVGAILKQVYKLSPDAAATLYRAVGESADAAARLLQGTYKLAANQTAKLLNANSYPVDQAAAAVKSLYRLESKELARVLHDAGCSAEATANVLREQCGKNGKQVGRILDQAGYGAEEIASVLKDLFDWSAKKTAKFMNDTLDYGKKKINAAMSGAGYSSKQIKNAFEDLWGAFEKLIK